MPIKEIVIVIAALFLGIYAQRSGLADKVLPF